MSDWSSDVCSSDLRKADPRRSLPICRRAPCAAQRQPDRYAERDPYPQVDDEDAVAIEPARTEGFEQANPVIVEPVERRMAETADVGEREQPTLMNRQPARRALAAPRLPAIEPDHQRPQQDRQQNERDRPVRSEEHTSELQSIMRNTS